MEGIVLAAPAEEYIDEIKEYRDEFPVGAMTATPDPEAIPGMDGLEKCGSVEEWLEMCRSEKGRISRYMAIRISDGALVGFCCLRSKLEYDDEDPEFASHIGYSVRPGERGKGYATEQLRLALRKAADAGLDEVRVICREDNEASRRAILANGGSYIDTVRGEESGFTVERYAIPVRRFF